MRKETLQHDPRKRFQDYLRNLANGASAGVEDAVKDIGLPPLSRREAIKGVSVTLLALAAASGAQALVQEQRRVLAASGSGGGASGLGGSAPVSLDAATATATTSATATATNVAKPSETPKPADTATPKPTDTPNPTATATEKPKYPADVQEKISTLRNRLEYSLTQKKEDIGSMTFYEDWNEQTDPQKFKALVYAVDKSGRAWYLDGNGSFGGYSGDVSGLGLNLKLDGDFANGDARLAYINEKGQVVGWVKRGYSGDVEFNPGYIESLGVRSEAEIKIYDWIVGNYSLFNFPDKGTEQRTLRVLKDSARKLNRQIKTPDQLGIKWPVGEPIIGPQSYLLAANTVNTVIYSPDLHALGTGRVGTVSIDQKVFGMGDAYVNLVLIKEFFSSEFLSGYNGACTPDIVFRGETYSTFAAAVTAGYGLNNNQLGDEYIGIITGTTGRLPTVCGR